jgi:hypothetical protein
VGSKEELIRRHWVCTLLPLRFILTGLLALDFSIEMSRLQPWLLGFRLPAEANAFLSPRRDIQRERPRDPLPNGIGIRRLGRETGLYHYLGLRLRKLRFLFAPLRPSDGNSALI